MLKTLLVKTIGVAAVAGGALLAVSPAQAQFIRYGVRTPFYRATIGQNLYTGTVYSRAATYSPIFGGTVYRQNVAYNPFTGATYASVGASNRFFGNSYASGYGYTYPAYTAALANYYGYGYGGYPSYYGLAGYGYGDYGYPSYGGYGYGYYDPYSPSAQLDAEGRYLVNVEQSRLTREQVRQARVDTRQRAFDEYLYERKNAPTWEDDRERLLQEELRRSENVPPANEVFSGKALNVLLAHVNGARTADVTLDPDVAKALKFTTGHGSAAIGLLKDGRVNWPLALNDADYRDARERLTILAHEAVTEATTNGRVDNAILGQMTRDLDRLDGQLRGKVSKTNPQNYIEAKQFLARFQDAVKAFAEPDVANYFNGKYTFHGKTVAELVRFMKANGLQFAPAVPGDEAAYTAAHQALVRYATGGNPLLRADVVRR
jgi:hypothetical protein